MHATFEKRLADQYGSLSSRLQDAGDYVVSNPVEVATRSLRSVSEESGLAPVTFTRLARALGYNEFEQLREEMRGKITQRINNFADRAGRLQAAHATQPKGFFSAHTSACLRNIEQMASQVDEDRLRQAVDQLHQARQVTLLGTLGSTGLVEYLSYMAEFCLGNWRLAGRMGSSTGVTLSDIGPEDAMIVITKPPFSKTSLRAARLAHERGAYVVVITDTHTCPAIATSSAWFQVPTDSSHFFSSYAATTVLVEAIIGMLVSRAGPEAQARIARVEESNRRLNIVLDGQANL